jgi:carbamoyl-phosphate synthase large subunit
MFPEVDPVLGPEMRSTGEVLGMAQSYGLAFFKAQEAANARLPLEGSVLFTVADHDKHAALEAARQFAALGFELRATAGTCAFLASHGVTATPVKKLHEGRPNLVDAIKNGEVQLLINTPAGRQGTYDDSYLRKAAIGQKVPYITTAAAAVAAAKGIAARRQGHEAIRSLQEYHSDLE